MSTEFTNEGYEDLRLYIKNNWNFIALVDDNGAEQIRKQVPADAGASFSSGHSTNPLTARVEVTGSEIQNAGGSLPVTLASSESYISSSATSPTSSDSFTNVTIEAQNDKVILTHDFEVPNI